MARTTLFTCDRCRAKGEAAYVKPNGWGEIEGEALKDNLYLCPSCLRAAREWVQRGLLAAKGEGEPEEHPFRGLLKKMVK